MKKGKRTSRPLHLRPQAHPTGGSCRLARFLNAIHKHFVGGVRLDGRQDHDPAPASSSSETTAERPGSAGKLTVKGRASNAGSDTERHVSCCEFVFDCGNGRKTWTSPRAVQQQKSEQQQTDATQADTASSSAITTTRETTRGKQPSMYDVRVRPLKRKGPNNRVTTSRPCRKTITSGARQPQATCSVPVLRNTHCGDKLHVRRTQSLPSNQATNKNQTCGSNVQIHDQPKSTVHRSPGLTWSEAQRAATAKPREPRGKVKDNCERQNGTSPAEARFSSQVDMRGRIVSSVEGDGTWQQPKLLACWCHVDLDVEEDICTPRRENAARPWFVPRLDLSWIDRDYNGTLQRSLEVQTEIL